MHVQLDYLSETAIGQFDGSDAAGLVKRKICHPRAEMENTIR